MVSYFIIDVSPGNLPSKHSTVAKLELRLGSRNSGDSTSCRIWATIFLGARQLLFSTTYKITQELL